MPHGKLPNTVNPTPGLRRTLESTGRVRRETFTCLPPRSSREKNARQPIFDGVNKYVNQGPTLHGSDSHPWKRSQCVERTCDPIWPCFNFQASLVKNEQRNWLRMDHIPFSVNAKYRRSYDVPIKRRANILARRNPRATQKSSRKTKTPRSTG